MATLYAINPKGQLSLPPVKPIIDPMLFKERLLKFGKKKKSD